MPVHDHKALHRRQFRFDLSRLHVGELIAAVGGVALFLVMFFPWYNFAPLGKNSVGGHLLVQTRLPGDVDAWQAFSLLDFFLLVTIVAAVGLAVVTAAARSVALPVAASVLTTLLGIIAVGLIIYRMIVYPSSNGVVTNEFGIYLGVLSVCLIAVGGWQAMRDEGTTWREAHAQAKVTLDRARAMDVPKDDEDRPIS